MGTSARWTTLTVERVVNHWSTAATAERNTSLFAKVVPHKDSNAIVLCDENREPFLMRTLSGDQGGH